MRSIKNAHAKMLPALMVSHSGLVIAAVGCVSGVSTRLLPYLGLTITIVGAVLSYRAWLIMQRELETLQWVDTPLRTKLGMPILRRLVGLIGVAQRV